MGHKFHDRWYYPDDIAHDLNDAPILSEALKQEVYACAWEYTRCVIPQYTNWKRYVAFMRTIIIGIIAEFRGELVDVVSSDFILGYSLNAVLDDLFEGTQGHQLMKREYKTFLLVTTTKTSEKRHGEIFRRYVNGLATSPRDWFRMRDCDALARFSIAAALACNDLCDVYPTEEQWEILTEIGDTLYDSVAFFKHRSEGETNNTFAYVPSDVRVESFRVARELLWAIDVSYAHKPEGQAIMNFIRFFGGPIHMMMRRYRFVEEGLTVGRLETEDVVAETRRNVKLWHRFDDSDVQNQERRKTLMTDDADLSCNESDESANSDRSRASSDNGGSTSASSVDGLVEESFEDSEKKRLESLLARSDELMFPGFATVLKRSDEQNCDRCYHRSAYGAKQLHRFGGVELCLGCKAMWRGYIESLPERVLQAFPDVLLKI
jgi:hypothetical protein